MNKIDKILQSAKLMSDEMKHSQKAFEDFEVEKSVQLPNDQGSVLLSMNGKYEITLVIDNPNKNTLSSDHLAEAFLLAHQNAITELQHYSKNQMQHIAKLLNDEHSTPPNDE